MESSKQLHVRRLREALVQMPELRAKYNVHSPEFSTWQDRVSQSLTELFGAEHSYGRRFAYLDFCLARVSMGPGPPPWTDHDQSRYEHDLDQAEQLLKDALEELEAAGLAATPGHTFWDLIHPDIKTAALTRFESAHYADAVESALKAVNARVRENWLAAGNSEQDGTKLMFSAFDTQNPAIRLADLSTQTGRDIQDGYKHIFAGAMLGIRNPKAHDIVVINQDRAIHFLFVASLLMHKLDEAATA